ncbi:nodulation protein NodZ [Methylibium sp.]|uniref:nodulation protein NodZ n=1 Tax=Methylibium sp. TaxID=2067992 RepID=UPI0017DF6A2A|nr:nodulation protein NodZ [Methylibium sp.]MBA3588109.1 hypothetical protein [Methylibium sp.]
MDSKYVLVKSYYGLGGDLCVLLGAMHFAEKQQRAVVVDWSGGFYGAVDNGNLINEYFESPDFQAPSALRGRGLSIFPPQWINRIHLPPLSYVTGVDLTLSRPEEVPAGCDADCVVITRDSRVMHRRPEEFFSVAQSLRPVARIRDNIEETLQRIGTTRHSIGIHFRHGNGERKVIPPDPRWFRNRINARMRSLGVTAEDVTLYVATDCGSVVDYFRRYYPHTIDFTKLYRPNGEGAMHINRTDLCVQAKMKLADEALVDMYVLSRCKFFIGSRGFFSLFVRLLRGRMHSILYEGSRVFDNYNFSDIFYSIDRDPLLAPLLKRARQPIDGLFVNLTPEGRHVHYFDEPLHLIPAEKTVLTSAEILAFRKSITARRTY